ncbi:sulfotransferase [Pseudoruegeria sp. HB172150]|uniref:sulfotransferase family protein n=1 Tax=Pseudoruegeria sp. HB172150 TaxID=2721164 RepID=UPI00352E1A9A
MGAMKSGTSSLRDMLRQHPEIDLYKGEIHYFDRADLYARGAEWYHGHFDFSRPALHGDKSPSYSLDPGTPARLAAYNPGARIVWILRDPVRRLVSNYHHSKRRRPEAMEIAESLARAGALAARNSPMAYLYRSQYDRHLDAFLAHFPRAQQHVTIFEEFLSDSAGQARALAEWLGVDPEVPMAFPHSNENRAGVKRRYPVAPEVTAELRVRLAPTVDYVERFLGREIPAWHMP